MSLMQNCLLFPMVGLKSEIFAFIADNFTVEVLLQNLWTTLYSVQACQFICPDYIADWLLRASAKREASFYWYTLKIWVWAAAGRPWSRFWEAYISGTVSPIDKRSSLVGSPIPSAVHGTNAESCQCQLGHVARATRGDVTNVPPVVSR